MARASLIVGEGVVLRLTEEEALFLRRLLGAHIVGIGAQRALSARIHDALADAGDSKLWTWGEGPEPLATNPAHKHYDPAVAVLFLTE